MEPRLRRSGRFLPLLFVREGGWPLAGTRPGKAGEPRSGRRWQTPGPLCTAPSPVRCAVLASTPATSVPKHGPLFTDTGENQTTERERRQPTERTKSVN